MIIDKNSVKKSVALGAILTALAIILGAFGAHALKKILTPSLLDTFLTGNRYHMFHGLSFIVVSILELIFSLNLKVVRYFFLAGIIAFSGMCYVYALTSVKTFAMIVPLGGVAYIVGWLVLAVKIYKNE
ncbi:DUF423 domain-containing protein [Bacteriovorax sp. Seq25_V]|uniref:DUF423 domain-containing protein n=1 Tax=Bacteriovorax sp. Seq25_V TaxID=1201288 RepID=UPI000389F127|nr:DUF423 domain-containing protein [Bacteriovorax sp. Seq25_V]EQC47751.1 PF04241 family protein [Bacteriovorax sp. Seq25_V]